MKSLLSRRLAVLLASLGFALPASATSSGVDFTDLWFLPSEQGWGINLIQQSNIIFATLFVYGADSSARWYVASDLRGSGTNFSGTLYQTTGPAFSAPWTGNANVTPVGSMTINFTSANTGTLTYVVSGASVAKQIQRQTWAGNNLGGQYVGGFTGTASSCSNPANNGAVLATGTLNVQHAGNPVLTITFRNAAGLSSTCSYSGPFSPAGRMGTIVGTYTCNVGGFATSGGFTLSEVDVSRNGFTSVYSANDNLGCTYSGYFGGIRDVPG